MINNDNDMSIHPIMGWEHLIVFDNSIGYFKT